MNDKEIKQLIEGEKKRQKEVISLIASENYVSQDVLKALGSELTNKYAEGYPGKRYYGGQTFTDKIELLAQKRALKLFKLSPTKWHVNVQPLSGSPANVAVYTAIVPKGEKIMGMSLDNGGHLTHGHKVSITGKFWVQVPFGVHQKTEMLDYDEIKKIAKENKPNLIVAGFTAYPRRIDFKKFREIADVCGAMLMVDMSHFAGLVAGGAYPSPFEYSDVVTTTVHKTLRGPRSAIIFSRRDVTLPNAKGEQKSISDLIDRAVFPGMQGGPHVNQIAAVAVALKEADSPEFKKYAKQVVKNAQVLAEELKKKGWRIVSDGTDSHLLLVDTWMNGLGVSGAVASDLLEKAGVIVNKNTIPGETRSPMDPSGIRIGTPGETTRGRTEKDMVKIADLIDKTLKEKSKKKK